MVGRLEYILKNYRYETVSALQWKGQTPKDVTRKRVLKEIKINSRGTPLLTLMNEFPASQRHNLFDAAGLALYGLRKNER